MLARRGRLPAGNFFSPMRSGTPAGRLQACTCAAIRRPWCAALPSQSATGRAALSVARGPDVVALRGRTKAGRTAAAAGLRPVRGGPGWAAPAPRPGPPTGGFQRQAQVDQLGAPVGFGPVQAGGAEPGCPGLDGRAQQRGAADRRRGAAVAAGPAAPARPSAAPRRPAAAGRRRVAGAHFHVGVAGVQVQEGIDSTTSSSTSGARGRRMAVRAPAPGARRWAARSRAAGARAAPRGGAAASPPAGQRAAHLVQVLAAAGGQRQRLALAREQRLPSRASSVATRLPTALAVTCSSPAARSKLPSRAAASKARRPSMEGSRRSARRSPCGESRAPISSKCGFATLLEPPRGAGRAGPDLGALTNSCCRRNR
jgi:hypothetical protein